MGDEQQTLGDGLILRMLSYPQVDSRDLILEGHAKVVAVANSDKTNATRYINQSISDQ